MRNPDRIEPLLQALRSYWIQYPDMRLGQIIYNCTPDENVFNVEDDHIYARLQEELINANYDRDN